MSTGITTDPLPRCRHDNCLVDGSGERLEPPCGCRFRQPAPDAGGEWRVESEPIHGHRIIDATGRRIVGNIYREEDAVQIARDHTRAAAVPRLVEALRAALPTCDRVVYRDNATKCGALASWWGSFGFHYCDEHKKDEHVLMEVAAQGVAALTAAQIQEE